MLHENFFNWKLQSMLNHEKQAQFGKLATFLKNKEILNRFTTEIRILQQ